MIDIREKMDISTKQLEASGIKNSIGLGLPKSHLIQPPRRTKRFQNFQNLSDSSALEDLLEVEKNEGEEMEKRRKTINAVGLGRNIADMVVTNRSGIEFFAPEYNKDNEKQQLKNQNEEHCKNIGINIEEKRRVENERIKICEEKFKKLNENENNEEDEEFWTGISALKTTKYGISTWCIAWNGAASYYVSDRLCEFLLNLFIGLLGFWQAKKLSKRQNFRKLLKLLASTLIFIQISLMILQRSALEAFSSFKITLPIATNHQIKKQPFNFNLMVKFLQFLLLGIQF
ncbi:hypothetical protein Mgra_00008223 [Meloidogyne graminicola]|uniref:Uncharacterized protein n=1 Tax=Meloidogyne graminicola TaxID=189291 RepID=A0A8S9ZGC6_9BILA|nr:hypothetical protein Mgra_00008223 [Meloidogyne graminicola]